MGNVIREFQGEYRWLSNFYPASVTYMGIYFTTAEHAYQAAKCAKKEDAYIIADLPSPADAKRKGKRVTMRDDWEDVKDDIMYDIVYLKFASHPTLTKKLLDTGDDTLMEGNYWNDTYWGVDKRSGRGQNKLGKILMRVREELRG